LLFVRLRRLSGVRLGSVEDWLSTSADFLFLLRHHYQSLFSGSSYSLPAAIFKKKKNIFFFLILFLSSVLSDRRRKGVADGSIKSYRSTSAKPTDGCLAGGDTLTSFTLAAAHLLSVITKATSNIGH
jgi:hypothetical protein